MLERFLGGYALEPQLLCYSPNNKTSAAFLTSTEGTKAQLQSVVVWCYEINNALPFELIVESVYCAVFRMRDDAFNA